MQKKKDGVKKFSLSIVLGVVIFLAFMAFFYKNSKRITAQNAEYIADAAKQKSERMEYILADAQKNIGILAYLYGQTLPEKGTVDVRELQEMADQASFDFIEFVDVNGKSMNQRGEIKDISDQEYFKRGIQGEAGMTAIISSGRLEENRVAFYAPLKNQGEIIGLLIGFYEEEQLEGLLNSSYFGETTGVYLCTREGEVIAASVKEEAPENIIAFFGKNGRMRPKDIEDMRQAFGKGEAYSPRYEGDVGPGTAYVTKIQGTDFMVFQIFPPKITQRMINRANVVGVILAAELIVALLLYLVIILIFNHRQKKILLKENREMSYVIDGVTRLFDRFVLIDLEQNTYQYLAGTYQKDTIIPPEGSYPELAEYLTSLTADKEEGKRIGEELQTENIQKHLGKHTVNLSYEYYEQRNKGQWKGLNIICLKREEGVPRQVLFARQDVTESKMLELKKNAALQDAFQAAEAANQAKREFLSHMSHDIRTPMNAIMGMTAIAAIHVEDTARVTDCLNKITISSKHLLGLINEVLDMSKIESGKLVLSEEEFSLSEVIENLVGIFHSQIEKKQQTLNVSIADLKHERVIGDAQRLQQVFVNIMGNAVKFTPEDGSISLTINEKPSKNISNGLFEFVFKDNGIGMSQSFLERVFEPFSRAGDSRIEQTEGTGLGMSIAKNIVHMMNGDIQVNSSPGKGSEFTVSVYLKLCDEDNENLDKLAGLNVLVVDDEQYVCENACEMLNSIGMRPDWVTDGDSAIERLLLAQEKGEDYTAVILDWKMPGKDGIQTAREIRERVGQDIPIIILSAYDWSAIEQEARSAGVNDFISKPLFKSRLVYVMKHLLEKQEEDFDEKNIVMQRYEEKRVLLVEDNKLNMEIAEEIMKMIGFSVEKAWDGIQAVEQVEQSEENYYDLIFMDIQMPRMNGYEATEAIRKLDRADVKTLPIIAMSANAFTDDIRKAKESGMDAHIAKPIEMAKLMSAIDTWIKK